ncbi:MAG TPA: polysaccharide deacetylase family protein [Opitutaceae bacterium]|nr:polysaccharide deacetylase family protein [Opitutaceae bacterium]
MLRFLILLSAVGKAAALLVWVFRPSPAVSLLCFCGPDCLILYHLLAPGAQGVCRLHTRFETARAEIWLTIDDGPDPEDTPRLLDLLDRHRASATFFLIGERAGRHPALVAEILRRGHQVGHHTQTHPTKLFWCASRARVRRELDDGTAALRRGGAEPRWFRPPVGIKNLFLAGALAERGLTGVGWNVRSHDFRSRDPSEVASRVMGQVTPGAIVLMHEGPALDPRVRVHAISLVLDGLAARKFACVLPEADRLR